MENSLIAIFGLYIVQDVLSNFGAIIKIHHQDAEHYATNLWETLIVYIYSINLHVQLYIHVMSSEFSFSRADSN